MKKEIFHIKMRFTLMTLFFLVLLLTSNIGYNYIKKIPNPANQAIYYNAQNKVILFNHPEERSIILRMDDPGDITYNEVVIRLTEDILSQNKHIVLGAIPERTLNNPEFLGYIQKKAANPRIEIAMHGYNHEENEFSNADALEAESKIRAGLEIFRIYLGVWPVTFIPPYSSFSEEYISLLKENEFKIFSSAESRYKLVDGILIADYTIETHDYENNIIHTNQEIVDKCDESLYKINLCVIAFHPQDFLTIDGQINEVKYQDFFKLLEGLDKLNVRYITFKDLLTSENIE